MKRFTDQIRQIADDDACRASWNGEKNGKAFRCGLCGHHFKIGDGWRWVYGDGRTFIRSDGNRFGVRNFLVCDACDGPDVLDQWIARHEEFFADKFWAFR